MISFPNAKINLGLNIISKRADGYHNLETVFYPVNIQDALEIVLAKDGKDSFIEAGMRVDSSPDNNLVMKALKLMREYYDIPPVEVHLLKKIPFGAGLGGGSSDASFMLKLLNEEFMLKLSDNDLARLAVRLGADCPFFIYNRPMFATGIGEQLEPIRVSIEKYHLVLVKPDIHIPTRDAFALIKPRKPELSIKDILIFPASDWKDSLWNDFEDSIFPQYPEIARIKKRLYDMGAVYASMSGSGSSIYGLFEEETDLASYFPGCYVWEERKY
ncbi:4-(cytidine 5'-diphospho)-2-C-methyl-D-erythritol kinase [Dysgonomonas sp. 216]|uniref:4-(cytidine 5'-diphospho)-2-C-methyl-D-erythritol kinase n=1 Tax=Dysgonomonas sp. 216 TaxID=2302934 RepID=UPI0013D46152|nr:4-(cytidine 5'-diphospho)-2-C-methyl-D-erythritol kinase [Dysgonomonas sp. 216]NDW17984.1 4-(cytidine 5'-diphospho)-2-C-methyl-D-erythritol kinase [Dysgonomonas sp. 216]